MHLVKAILPPNRDFALRTPHLLVVPIDGELVKAVSTFDFGLPAWVWAGRTHEGDPVRIATTDHKLSSYIR